MATKLIYDWSTQTYRLVMVTESEPHQRPTVQPARKPTPEPRPYRQSYDESIKLITNYLHNVGQATTREIADAIDAKIEATFYTLKNNPQLFESLGKHLVATIDGHGRQLVRTWKLTSRDSQSTEPVIVGEEC